MTVDVPVRNTTVRDRHRKAIARTKPPCSLCGDPIDYSLRYPHLECFVVDHVVPWKLGGPDTLDNKVAAHNRCNRLKSDKVADDHAPVTFITARAW